VFEALLPADLDTLATALADGRLGDPPSEFALRRSGIAPSADLLSCLAALTEAGFSAAQSAAIVRMLAEERRRAEAAGPRISAVISGPDPSSAGRETAAVVNQLFNEARREILVTGYAIYQGASIFRPLAERHDADESLKVTVCLDLSRRGGDTTRDSDLIIRFARDFGRNHWHGRRMPRLFFDPRGLDPEPARRAVLHAKAIVIDRIKVLVTSANLTPAAHFRNVELGLIVDGGTLPTQIADHFDQLMSKGNLKEIMFS
jgi:phosphatidylserine/phosphatidylglycerophosphate/cardiolipin synthase-like enzyme